MPEQLDTTPPPGHGRSRLTDQNASRAMWFALAQSRICVQMDGDVSSCWSDRPFIPGLFCLTIFRAPRIRSCTASFSNSSMFSMSMSMNFSPYALMTCWYAPASADALEQLGPSLLPDQPPKEISTSPPLDRMVLIACWSTPPVSGRLPSQAGLQPPPESMNAMVNCLIPVADITVVGDGGSPQPSYRYGAAILEPPPVQPVVLALIGPLFADSPAELYAATVYVCDVQVPSPEIVALVPLTVARTVLPS